MAMGPPPPPPPPPPRNPSPDGELRQPNEHQEPSTTPMGPPPTDSETAQNPLSKSATSNSTRTPVPYTIPEWSSPPCHKFFLEVLKDGSIVGHLDTFEKGAYMFGRVDICDFVLEHPTISRFHAVLQYKRNGEAYLYDLNSTHGTSINKRQVEKNVYVELHVGDIIRFGHSSRLYIFQGPPELMPKETDLNIIREAKIRQEMFDREASLHRARREASLADGISWGMGEDAIEEEEDDGNEVVWQSYKGQLTEKQEKTREKIIKRHDKIAHMKKEIDAIRAKDIAQGGLTQGQQTQIARNEQRMTQILEELENLEETLNDSIRESIGAHSGRRSSSKKKGSAEDEEDFSSDEDEFYDRTKKPSVQKSSENQSVETADSLLDKRDAIMKEMEDKKNLISMEKNKVSETTKGTEVGDALDAYMSGLSSQLVLDTTAKLEKELSTLQTELDRILFLLRIADPSGEAAKKRDSRVQVPELPPTQKPAAATTKVQPSVKQKKGKGVAKPTDNASEKNEAAPNLRVASESGKSPKDDKIVTDAPDPASSAYIAPKPQWLGAVHNEEPKETEEVILNTDEGDEFVDYKDRQKIMLNDGGIENAAPGLILRKQRNTEVAGTNDNAAEKSTASVIDTIKAEEAVALLLKHKRGYHAEDDELFLQETGTSQQANNKDNKRPKRVLGPEKPSFIDTNSDYESWVPPKGQSGDGRTSLNDHFGY